MALTPEELALHEKAIAKMRRKLFARYSPGDYFSIPGTEEILAPSVTLRCQPSFNLTLREIRWGGLRWQVDGGYEPTPLLVCVSHWEMDRFNIQVTAAKGYTMHIDTFEFVTLHGSLMSMITASRANKLLPPKEKPSRWR
jgi:hypothetical protein